MPESTDITCCAVHSDCTASTMSYTLHHGNSQPITTSMLWLIFTQCLQSISVTIDGMICTFQLCYITSICWHTSYKGIVTELSPSPMNQRYLKPWMLSDIRNPSRIMSASIAQEEPDQFLKH